MIMETKEISAEQKKILNFFVCAGLLLFIALQPVKAGFDYEDYKNWIKQKGYCYCHRSEDYPKILSPDEAYSMPVTGSYVLNTTHIFDLVLAPFELRLQSIGGVRYAFIARRPEEYRYVASPLLTSSTTPYYVMVNNNSLSHGTQSHEFFKTVLPDNITYITGFNHDLNGIVHYNGYNWLRDVSQVVGIYMINFYPQNMSQSYARGCKNLKIISFASILNYAQDILLDCPNLETVRFTCPLTSGKEGLYRIFNTYYDRTGTYYDRTGTYYYPKLTTFVVPDAHYDAYVTEINKATSLVRDGHAYIIPESLYKCPRVKGIAVSQPKITNKN